MCVLSCAQAHFPLFGHFACHFGCRGDSATWWGPQRAQLLIDFQNSQIRPGIDCVSFLGSFHVYLLSRGTDEILTCAELRPAETPQMGGPSGLSDYGRGTVRRAAKLGVSNNQPVPPGYRISPGQSPPLWWLARCSAPPPTRMARAGREPGNEPQRWFKPGALAHRLDPCGPGNHPSTLVRDRGWPWGRAFCGRLHSTT